jgi:hypothetical protein
VIQQSITYAGMLGWWQQQQQQQQQQQKQKQRQHQAAQGAARLIAQYDS